jgi:hypothetical protein
VHNLSGNVSVLQKYFCNLFGQMSGRKSGYLLSEPKTLQRVDHGDECPLFKCKLCKRGKLCPHELACSMHAAFRTQTTPPFLKLFKALRSLIAIFGADYGFVICTQCVRKELQDPNWRLTDNDFPVPIANLQFFSKAYSLIMNAAVIKIKEIPPDADVIDVEDNDKDILHLLDRFLALRRIVFTKASWEIELKIGSSKRASDRARCKQCSVCESNQYLRMVVNCGVSIQNAMESSDESTAPVSDPTESCTPDVCFHCWTEDVESRVNDEFKSKIRVMLFILSNFTEPEVPAKRIMSKLISPLPCNTHGSPIDGPNSILHDLLHLNPLECFHPQADGFCLSNIIVNFTYASAAYEPLNYTHQDAWINFCRITKPFMMETGQNADLGQEFEDIMSKRNLSFSNPNWTIWEEEHDAERRKEGISNFGIGDYLGAYLSYLKIGFASVGPTSSRITILTEKLQETVVRCSFYKQDSSGKHAANIYSEITHFVMLTFDDKPLVGRTVRGESSGEIASSVEQSTESTFQESKTSSSFGVVHSTSTRSELVDFETQNASVATGHTLAKSIGSTDEIGISEAAEEADEQAPRAQQLDESTTIRHSQVSVPDEQSDSSGTHHSPSSFASVETEGLDAPQSKLHSQRNFQSIGSGEIEGNDLAASSAGIDYQSSGSSPIHFSDVEGEPDNSTKAGNKRRTRITLEVDTQARATKKQKRSSSRILKPTQQQTHPRTNKPTKKPVTVQKATPSSRRAPETSMTQPIETPSTPRSQRSSSIADPLTLRQSPRLLQQNKKQLEVANAQQSAAIQVANAQQSAAIRKDLKGIGKGGSFRMISSDVLNSCSVEDIDVDYSSEIPSSYGDPNMTHIGVHFGHCWIDLPGARDSLFRKVHLACQKATGVYISVSWSRNRREMQSCIQQLNQCSKLIIFGHGAFGDGNMKMTSGIIAAKMHRKTMEYLECITVDNILEICPAVDKIAMIFCDTRSNFQCFHVIF